MIEVVMIGCRGFPGVEGGLETHCQELSSALVRLGCRVTVMARVPYVGSDVVDYEGVHIVPVHGPTRKGLEPLYHALVGLAYCIPRRHAIVHFHGIAPAAFSLVAKAFGMKVVVTTHGHNYLHGRWGTLTCLALRVAERVGLRAADAVISVAQGMARRAQQRYGEKVQFIPNGVRAVAHDGAVPPPQGQPFVLAAGRLIRLKAFHKIIEAFDVLRGQGRIDPACRLVIAGGDVGGKSYAARLCEYARQRPYLTLRGSVERTELLVLYRQAALFVHPSRYEGLPLVVLEALAAGAQCLVSDIPAHRELQVDSLTFVTPGQPQDWADAIEHALHHPLSDAARRRQTQAVLQVYDWDGIARQTLATYRRISRPA